jgi:hypothetical protein
MSTTTTITQTQTTQDYEEQPTLTLRPVSYKPLHPTFIAEVEGWDLTHPTPELVQELKKALAKVCSRHYRKNRADAIVRCSCH